MSIQLSDVDCDGVVVVYCLGLGFFFGGGGGDLFLSFFLTSLPSFIFPHLVLFSYLTIALTAE